MIGSSFLFGTFAGSFLIPRLADIYGRRPMFILGLILFIATCIGLIVSRDIKAMYAFLFLGGISECGRCYVAYVYAIEIVPKRMQSMAGLMYFLAFAMCKIFVCLYFMLSKQKHWYILALTAIGMSVVSLLITVMYLPESPRFLYAQKRYHEAQKVLRHIQKANDTSQDYTITLPNAEIRQTLLLR